MPEEWRASEVNLILQQFRLYLLIQSNRAQNFPGVLVKPLFQDRVLAHVVSKTLGDDTDGTCIESDDTKLSVYSGGYRALVGRFPTWCSGVARLSSYALHELFPLSLPLTALFFRIARIMCTQDSLHIVVPNSQD